MLISGGTMKTTFDIPFAPCQECKGSEIKGHCMLQVELGLGILKELKLCCSSCPWEVDLLASVSRSSAEAKAKVARLIKQLWPTIVAAAKSLPRNGEELRAAIANPKHPFTAAVLAAFTILAMELSGFGIFALLTWVLGNLVLNPVSWVLIPFVVAVVLAHRDRFQKERIDRMRAALVALDGKLERGEIGRSEYEAMRDHLLRGDFSAA
jgi:uncharacterized membrane protein